jgi:hypothetical protein
MVGRWAEADREVRGMEEDPGGVNNESFSFSSSRLEENRARGRVSSLEAAARSCARMEEECLVAMGIATEREAAEDDEDKVEREADTEAFGMLVGASYEKNAPR